MKTKWSQFGNNFHLSEVTSQIDFLPVGCYKTEVNPMTGELFLSRVGDKFEMPKKIYGFEESLVNRVIKTYKNTTGNLGILLNGEKGTGKTVTGKLISNMLELPVIIVTGKINSLPNFLNELQQDVIVFFDEYEKIYNNYDHTVLTVMDGVLDSAHRKLFILTTNELHINTNMLQRPSRLRYHKTFGDLSAESIKEIIEDLLVYKERAVAVEKFVSELEIITVDIVKEVIHEVNIHNEDPDAFGDVFNVKKVDNVFNVFEIQTNGSTKTEFLRYSKVHLNPTRLSKRSVGQSFYVNGEYIGEIKKVTPDGTLVEIEFTGDEEVDAPILNSESSAEDLAAFFKNDDSEKENSEDEDEYPRKIFRIEKTYHTHRSYAYGYGF